MLAHFKIFPSVSGASPAMWKLYARLGKIEAHLTRLEQLQGTEKGGRGEVQWKTKTQDFRFGCPAT
jgi:hypothetical protein